ncbi:mercury methylation ferredoxin HgcB [Gemmatimonadota bacterium]
MAQLTYLKDVVTLRLDEEKCIGCAMCEIVCPHAVFTMIDRIAVIGDRDDCMECGACARNCPTDAIDVKVGVGCAAAVINYALGRESSSCCCVIEPDQKDQEEGASPCDCC